MGLIVLAIEFVLGLFVEQGIKLETALQERGLEWLVPVGLLVIGLFCLGVCCMTVILLSWLSI